MTLEKAIQTLTGILRYVELGHAPEEHQSIKLGIEALKRLKEHREDHIDITFRALPGEAKD